MAITDLYTYKNHEHVRSTLTHHSHTNFPTNDSLQKWEKPIGRILRKHLHCIPKLSKSRLWDKKLMKAMNMLRPHNTCWRSATQALLQTLNNHRQDIAAWAQARWTLPQPHPLSDEARVRILLHQNQVEICAFTTVQDTATKGPMITYTVKHHGHLLPHLPRTELMYLYTDGSTKGPDSGAAVLLQIGEHYHALEYKLPSGFDIQYYCEITAMAAAIHPEQNVRALGFQIQETLADSTNAIFWTSKDSKYQKDPFLRKVKEISPQLGCPII